MAQSGAQTAEPAASVPSENAAVAAEPLPSEAKEETKEEAKLGSAPLADPRPPMAIGKEPADVEPSAAVPPAQSKVQGDAKSAHPPAHAPAKTGVVPALIEQPPKHEDAAPIARKPEPQLDMAALKTRLRETHAIGVFTKLALQNQVDDLLQQFRAHYLSGQKNGVAALRQPFDMLILKVLALIQEEDPSLAKTISGSREAIWGILADPVKFHAAS
jgi:hypothetical protein